MAADLDRLIADLRDETDELDRIVSDAGPSAMNTPSAAAGWTVGDTMAHLWFFDREASRALLDPEGFRAQLAVVLADPAAYMSKHLAAGREQRDRLLPAWRAERTRMIDAARAADPRARVPWYGPPMSPASFLTARLMETWAHGQDVADGLGVRRTATDRLRHICHLGVRTREFSFVVRGRQPPAEPVLVTLTSPGGDTWSWGDPQAADRVTGTALDFCLLVTQRRHLEDLDLRPTGKGALEWMRVAQAFAGEPSLTDPARRARSAG